MRKVYLSIFFLFISFSCFSQSTLDRELLSVSADLAEKLQGNNKKRVVVLYITDINKNLTTAGKYLADQISVSIVNIRGFQVFDRDNLHAIADAKRLMDEGYVDAASAKRLGQLLSVDAIIIGTYTVLSKSIRLTLKAFDVGNGLVVAASVKDLPLDPDTGSLLGISVYSNNSTNAPSRGFNSPIGTNEQDNNPSTVGAACEKLISGDYCFFNSTNRELTVTVKYNYAQPNRSYQSMQTEFILKSGESKCITGILAAQVGYPNHFVAIWRNPDFHWLSSNLSDKQYVTVDEGNFSVKKCASVSYAIK